MSRYPVPSRVVVEGPSGLRYAAYVDQLDEHSISLLLKEPLTRFDLGEVRLTFRAEGRPSLGMIGRVSSYQAGRTQVNFSHPLDCALLAAWANGEEVDLHLELGPALVGEPTAREFAMAPSTEPKKRRGDDYILNPDATPKEVLRRLSQSASAPRVSLERIVDREVPLSPLDAGRIFADALRSPAGPASWSSANSSERGFDRETLGEAYFDYFEATDV